MSGITKLGTTTTPQTKPVMGSVNKGTTYDDWEKKSAGNEKIEVKITPNAGETARHANKVWDLNKTEGPQCVATLERHTNLVNSVIQLKDDGI